MLADLSITRDTILQHAQALPAAPQVLGGLCELLQDLNTELDQISDEIRVDPALAARVIRLSNSVVFGGGSSVASIEEAVNRVGFAEIVRLVGIATVSGLVDRALAAYRVPADRFRESLLLHALASEALAAQTDIDPRAAYAGGLLRGVGMMVLDRMARGRIAYDAEAFATYSEWEHASFNVRATDVATMILDEWRFPAETVAAIEHHLAPEADRFAALLNLAGGIVAAHGFALPGEIACWTVTADKLATVGIDEAQWHVASAQAGTAFQIQRRAL
jgi:HD-like signal output (HDOD) protein